MEWNSIRFKFSLFQSFSYIRSEKKYRYESLITGEIQDEKPIEDDEADNIKHEGEQEYYHDESSKEFETRKHDSSESTSNTTEKDSVKSESSINITAPLPTTPYPPLPPIPEKDSLGNILPTVPPLPSEKNQNETLELTINPPSPPEEEKQLEKIEQRNQSANQVETFVVITSVSVLFS